jgi:hypothetical protein
MLFLWLQFTAYCNNFLQTNVLTPVTTPGVPLDGVIRTHTRIHCGMSRFCVAFLAKRPFGDKYL